MSAPGKAHHPLDGGSRITAYTFDPRELTLLTDKSDPIYDKRVEDPILRERILDIAMRGVETPISVRRRGSQNIVTKGKQRTKTVFVVNALAAGIPYTGSIKAVMRAIKDADEDLIKKVTMFTKGKPLKIKAVPANSGDDKDVRLSMRSENAHRSGDPLNDRIKFVQEEHEKFGTGIEELAIAEGVHEATIKRWLNADTAARPEVRKKRGKASAPSRKAISNLEERIKVHATPRELALLNWILGRSNGTDVAEQFLGTAA